MKSILTIILYFIITVAVAQQKVIIYKNGKDSLENFYVKRVPQGKIKGVLVLTMRGLSDSSKSYAFKNGILLLSVVPVKDDDYLKLMTDANAISRMDEMVSEVVKEYNIAPNKVIIGGMSVGGTAAVRYAENCYRKDTKSIIKPRGVFAVDSPLDYERFWHESQNAIKRNFNADALNEGKAIVKLFTTQLGGSPAEHKQNYLAISPFSYNADDGGNGKFLKEIAIRLYSEPDINWWIINRRKDYYDLNIIDNAALINMLQLSGNKKAELITTTNKGYRDNGSRHPHSWSIVDEKELLQWCEKLFSEEK